MFDLERHMMTRERVHDPLLRAAQINPKRHEVRELEREHARLSIRLGLARRDLEMMEQEHA